MLHFLAASPWCISMLHVNVHVACASCIAGLAGAVYGLPTKDNKVPYFHFQQTNGSLPFRISICSKHTEAAVFR
jgi:hypothetical protein